MRIKDFYGIYSTGTVGDPYKDGVHKMRNKFFSKKNIDIAQKKIKQNLYKIQIKKKDLKNKNIMNIGSGRESLAFLQFKPKKIFHYDVSPRNIKMFKKFLKKKNLCKLIESKLLDLSKDKLPRDSFDFIYLHGVIQHIDDVDKGLKNLILSMKLNGKMWFYFYRPGALNTFIGSLQRELLRKVKIKKFFQFLKINYDKNFVDRIMDDTYVPNRQLFYPDTYNKNFKKNSLINFGNSYLRNYNHKVDFLNYHESVVFFLRKKKNLSNIRIHGLNRNNQENVLKKDLYKNKRFKEFQEIIDLFYRIKLKRDIDLFNIVVKLENIKIKVVNIFYRTKKLSKKQLYKFTREIKKILNYEL